MDKIVFVIFQLSVVSELFLPKTVSAYLNLLKIYCKTFFPDAVHKLKRVFCANVRFGDGGR